MVLVPEAVANKGKQNGRNSKKESMELLRCKLMEARCVATLGTYWVVIYINLK